MHRLLHVLLLLLTGLALAAGALATLEWEDIEGRLDPTCIAERKEAGRKSLPPAQTADLDLPAVLYGQAPAEIAAPRPAAATRILIHRYNE